jgi:hypothetical protein
MELTRVFLILLADADTISHIAHIYIFKTLPRMFRLPWAQFYFGDKLLDTGLPV